MRSKQLNFFLTPKDQEELMISIERLGPFSILLASVDNGRIICSKNAAVKKFGEDRLRIYLARPDDLTKIIIENDSIDVIRSPVVEFSRCYYASGLLRRGRFYFTTAYYDSTVLITKDTIFVDWASAVLSKSRRSLIMDKTSRHYYGNEARTLSENGDLRVTCL